MKVTEANWTTNEFADHAIRMRNQDGYFSATDMCKVGNKLYGHYRENSQTKEYLDELSKDIKLSISQLVEVRKGGNSKKYKQGTWVHPHVAIHLAQWLSPKFSVSVSKWVMRFMYGDLTLIEEIKQNNHLMNEQLKQSQLLLAEKDQQLREAEERAEHQKRGMDQIRQFIENSKVREMNEKIYIAFCPLDAKQNIFKVGGCQSAALLKTRLSTYNSPQSNDNLYAFAAVWNCHKFAEVENRIKQIIGEFRQDGKKEVYLMHYNCLFTIIDFIINHYNEENEAVNNFIRTIVQNMTELKPVVPEPYQLDRVELVEVRNGEEVKRDIICLDNMSAQEQEALITDLVRRFRKPEQTTIRRSEFEDFIKMSGVQKFKKRTVWDHLKKIAAEIADLSLVY